MFNKKELEELNEDIQKYNFTNFKMNKVRERITTLDPEVTRQLLAQSAKEKGKNGSCNMFYFYQKVWELIQTEQKGSIYTCEFCEGLTDEVAIWYEDNDTALVCLQCYQYEHEDELYYLSMKKNEK